MNLPSQRVLGGLPVLRSTAVANLQAVHPLCPVRFPADLREGITRRAVAEAVKPAELVRRTVAEYLIRHPA